MVLPTDATEEANMSLSSYKLNVSIAVSDMPRAKEFYEGKLGLAAEQAGADGSRI